MMLEITTEDDLVFMLPLSVEEVVFEKYIDNFKVHERKFIEAVKANTKTPYDDAYRDAVDVGEQMELKKKIDSYVLTEEQREGLLAARSHLIAAVSSITEGDYDKIPYSYNEELGDNFRYHPDLENGYLSVEGIYKHLITIIETYNPTLKEGEPVFTIKGEPYYVTMTDFRGIIKGVTVGEMIVNLSMKSEAQKYYSNNNYGDGNMDFSLGLKEVAIFARPKGVKLPYKPLDRSIYINEQIKKFKESKLSLGDVLRIRFFFLNFIPEYMNQEFINTSGKSHSGMKIQTIKTLPKVTL